MEKLTLNYIGLDSWSRPVYQNTEGRLFVDTDNRSDRQPEICTKYNNSFDGEPDAPIKYIGKYKDLEVEFLPKRITEKEE